jgi:tetratricopeptide (TPR) repeat protein
MEHTPLPFPELGRIPFIGRTDILKQIDDIIKNPSPRPQIVFVSGRGGIGKTELLKEVLSRCAGKPDLLAAKDVVDVYHSSVRTKFGLADQIVNVLIQPGATTFSGYAEHRGEYSRQLLSASGAHIREQLDDLRTHFREGLRALSGQARVVFAVDTAEKLVTPPVHPGGEPQVDEVWSWLCELLSGLDNMLVLVGGRPQIDALPTVTNTHPALDSHRIELPPFRLDECRQYLDAVRVRLDRHGGYKREALRLVSLHPDSVVNAHHYTGGDPVSFALMADLVAVEGRLPDLLQESIVGLKPLSVDELRVRCEELQQWYIENLARASIEERPELGDTLVALSFLPRGATPELIARVAEIEISEARSRLAAIIHLSIVKVRPSDQRVFLHDEVYAMLRLWIQEAPNVAASNQRTRQSIQEYYDETVKSSQRRLNDLSVAFEQGNAPSSDDFDKIVAAYYLRRDLLVESLYYRLRQDPVRGFMRFYRYMREAVLNGDVVQHNELVITMTEFMAERYGGQEGHVSHGLDQRLVEGVLASQRMVRLWAEGRYQDVHTIAVKRRQERVGVYSIDEAIIDIWDAGARIYLGGGDNLGAAGNLLYGAIEFTLASLPPDADEQQQRVAEIWRDVAVLAFGLRIRGYYSWSLGRLQAAVSDYQEAVRLFRLINFKVELATALNDLGFVWAELGKFDDGEELVEEALTKRRELGAYPRVALSLNTLAMIALFEGKFGHAIQLATRARNVFRSLGIMRGEGLAELALAEAERRLGGRYYALEPAKWKEQLEAAMGHAKAARDIFKHTGELLRQAQAWVEIGCAYRDMLLVYDALQRQGVTTENANIEETVTNSANALRQAADIAGDVSLRWQVDALVNLAWLGQYAKHKDISERARSEALQLIRSQYSQYFVDPKTGKPQIDEDQAETWVWGQIGKIHTQEGEDFFEEYLAAQREGLDRDPESKLLHNAINHYALGLENNRYGNSEDSRDMQRVKQILSRRMRQLSNKERKVVARLLGDFEKEYHLSGPSFMRTFLERRAAF